MTHIMEQKNNLNPHNLEHAGFLVKQSGMLTLIQDAGRFGAHGIGLSNGGPIDSLAFKWANRLCGNDINATALEVSIGGLVLQAQCDTKIAVTGTDMPLLLNGQLKNTWQSIDVKAGDTIELAYATSGLRCYLAVLGGFDIKKQFGSCATVMREKVGGLSGDKLQAGDFLPCFNHTNQSNNPSNHRQQNYLLAPENRPVYNKEILLRTFPSYQQKHFSALEQRHFYSCEYQVSNQADRMGYRLTGRKIQADVQGILSEGICHGAVQIPADGQPIVLLNDRQTIGGYPKIGAVIAADTAKLGQAMVGAKVRFKAITMEAAHNAFHLELALFSRTELIPCA
jgi:biotin-dependent carboxylase-like uncharacterized protein